MALIPCPACGRQLSEAAPTCPGCGHPVAAPHGQSNTFKDALMRPEAVKNGITVLGVFVAAPWIARVIAMALFVILAIVVIVNKT
jgi:uncharacterized membrane protein YvbJ